MPKTKRRLRLRWVNVAIAFALLIALVLGVFNRAIQAPDPSAKPFYFKLEHTESTSVVLSNLQRQGVIRSYPAARLLALFRRSRSRLPIGTYKVGANMSARQVLDALANPIHQLLRLPENFWALRVAKLLEKNDVCTATDYMNAVDHPAVFAGMVDFPLPTGSLEGYLLPDTYDLPPLTAAPAVVERQLKAFDKKIYEPLGKPKELNRLLTIASLVELEVARDDERRLVASVIHNRLQKHMPLQIDAAVNYALGVWRPLKFRDYREAQGPYNLYRHVGLPPGPICSPSMKSIQAVLHPAKTDYIYYVALPSGQTLFAKTWAEHQANIAKRKAALAERARDRGL